MGHRLHAGDVVALVAVAAGERDLRRPALLEAQLGAGVAVELAELGGLAEVVHAQHHVGVREERAVEPRELGAHAAAGDVGGGGDLLVEALQRGREVVVEARAEHGVAAALLLEVADAQALEEEAEVAEAEVGGEVRGRRRARSRRRGRALATPPRRTG